jgi:hypothetical protein
LPVLRRGTNVTSAPRGRLVRNMLVAALFLCIGFLIAVLYIDLVFDVSALPHPREHAALPSHVRDPIATYYRYVTRNPYLLMVIMVTASACIVAEVVFNLVPRWAGYVSLLQIALSVSTAVFKVIPAARRLAIGGETPESQTRIIVMVLRYHILLLMIVLSLAFVQATVLAW